MSMKKRVLVTMGGYLPAQNYGGPVVSVTNLTELIGDLFDIYILTTNHEYQQKEPLPCLKAGWNKVGKAKVMYLADKDITYSTLKMVVNEIKPDLIYQNSLYDYMLSLPVLRLARADPNISVILAPRGEISEYSLSVRGGRKKAYIAFVRMFLMGKNVFFQATSQKEKEDILKYMKIKQDKLVFVENCATLTNMSIDPPIKKKGEAKLIYFARIHVQKNLLGALQSLHNIKGEVFYEVYGPLEQKDYWEICQREIEKLPLNIHVTYHGAVAHDMVYDCFSQSHALFMPTLNIENYGHTVVEAIMAERPSIISNRTPWSDMPSHGAGWVYPAEDTDSYQQAVQCLVDMTNEEYRQMVGNVKKYKEEKFNLNELRDKYKDEFLRVIKSTKICKGSK